MNNVTKFQSEGRKGEQEGLEEWCCYFKKIRAGGFQRASSAKSSKNPLAKNSQAQSRHVDTETSLSTQDNPYTPIARFESK